MTALTTPPIGLLFREGDPAVNRQRMGRPVWGWLLSLLLALAPITPALAKLATSVDGSHCAVAAQANAEADSAQHQHHQQAHATHNMAEMAVADSMALMPPEQHDCCSAGNDCNDCSVSHQSLNNPSVALTLISATPMIVADIQPLIDLLPVRLYRPPTSA